MNKTPSWGSYDVLDITTDPVDVPAAYKWRQVPAKPWIECVGTVDEAMDEATWWHTYAMPFLGLHYALFDSDWRKSSCV